MEVREAERAQINSPHILRSLNDKEAIPDTMGNAVHRLKQNKTNKIPSGKKKVRNQRC